MIYNPGTMWVKTTLQIVAAVAVLTLVGGMLFAGELNGDVAEYRRLSAEYQYVSEKTIEIREARKRLEAECRALEKQDPRFLEKTLREDFGYVRQNEFVIRFSD